MIHESSRPVKMMIQDHLAATLTTAESQELIKADEAAWDKDNRWILADLSTYTDSFGCPEIVEEIQTSLQGQGLPESAMQLRKVSWIPDCSETTRSQQSDHVRAACGYTLLNASRTGGVEGLEGFEFADSIFYALGMAVQRSEQLRYYRLLNPGQDMQLYNQLSGKRYAGLIAKYTSSQQHAFFESDWFNPSDTETELFKNMENRFLRNMREIGEIPTISSSPESTQEMNDILLGKPKDPGYSDQLVDLIGGPIETDQNRQELEAGINTYLAPIVEQFLKSKA